MHNHILLCFWSYYSDYRRNILVRWNVVITPFRNVLNLKSNWEQTFYFYHFSLFFRGLSLYSNTSLFQHFSIPLLLYSDNFLFGFCHTSIFFFFKRNLKNIQNMKLIKTETFVIYFSWIKNWSFRVVLKIEVLRVYFLGSI